MALLRKAPFALPFVLALLVGLTFAAGTIQAVTPLPVDTDGDGCTDAEELGAAPALGGQRDPANRYDFFDTPLRDRTVSVGDIAGVVAHFGAAQANPAGPPRYDPAFDRTPGAEIWQTQAGDGAVSIQDVFLVVAQFGHSCAELPPFYTVADPTFTPRPGATAYAGTYSGGAYKIEVPATWNGELVLWAHGFAGNSGVLSAGAPLLRDEILGAGYAWAASSYRENGYVPGYGARDTLALKDLFAELLGPPSRTYLVGASMGGDVAVLSLEQAPGEYDGALSLCGVASGVEILDYFAATWLAVGAFVTGVPPLDPDTATPQEMIAAILQAKSLLGQPGAYTQAGEQFKSIIINYTGGPRPFDSEGFDQWYDFTFILLIDSLNAQDKWLPTARQGINRAVATNVGAVYDIDPGLGLTDDEINTGVVRWPADPQARAGSEFAEFVPRSGQLSVPLMSLHGTGDYFVPFGLEVSYLQSVQAAGKGDLLVQRAYRHSGHCAFNTPDLVEAFNDLVTWVETGVRPWGDDLSGDLTNIGR